MARSKEEIDRLAAETEAWLDDVDPVTLTPEDLSDLQRVTTAADAVTAAERELRDAVVAARARGRSWGRIGIALGVSRQAALKRFGGDEERPPVPKQARTEPVPTRSARR